MQGVDHVRELGLMERERERAIGFERCLERSPVMMVNCNSWICALESLKYGRNPVLAPHASCPVRSLCHPIARQLSCLALLSALSLLDDVAGRIGSACLWILCDFMPQPVLMGDPQARARAR